MKVDACVITNDSVFFDEEVCSSVRVPLSEALSATRACRSLTWSLEEVTWLKVALVHCFAASSLCLAGTS